MKSASESPIIPVDDPSPDALEPEASPNGPGTGPLNDSEPEMVFALSPVSGAIPRV